MLRCGLIGKKLGHSYSPQIHERLGDYSYKLFEMQEEDIGGFLRSDVWDGLNVTVPYKKSVIPFMDSLSETAEKTGSVNTVVRTSGGEIKGCNTDVAGFTELVKKSGMRMKGKKTLVLGSGGASSAVRAALENIGSPYVVISRTGENNYDNLRLHSDARFIVNTTPVGMYPDNGRSPVDLSLFPHCEGVIDLIYNPCRTALLMQAEKLEIPCENGLYMLVAQARKSAELFTGKAIDDRVVSQIHTELAAASENIVLIGMPGCGKTTVAREIGRISGRQVLDSDEEIKNRTGKTPAQIITEEGESTFRKLESEVLSDFGKQSGAVIATGGGAVTVERNYPCLHQNGIIIRLDRDLNSLPDDGRPITKAEGIKELFKKRDPLYRKFSDVTVRSDSSPETVASEVIRTVGRLER